MNHKVLEIDDHDMAYEDDDQTSPVRPKESIKRIGTRRTMKEGEKSRKRTEMIEADKKRYTDDKKTVK